MFKNETEKAGVEIEITDGVENHLAKNQSDERTEKQSETTAEKVEEKKTGSENQFRDQLQRLQAEFSNYKRRVEAERLLLSDLIKGDFVVNLLPILDDFERLRNHNTVGNSEFAEGIRLIHEKLLKALAEQGLKKVETVGHKFNPKLHEAMLVESHENMADDSIIEEWRKGYLFKEKLLRPAQVKVNKLTPVEK